MFKQSVMQMSPELKSHEPTTAEPKGPSPTMARARAAVHSDRVADAERGQARTASLPPLSSVVDEQDRADLAVTVAEAADLVGVTQQAINQLINRGSLPAYRADGKRWVLVVDLVESAPARRQAAQAAELATRRADHDYRVAHPWPGVTDCTGPWDECQVCGPVTDEWERLGDEPADEPAGLDGLDDDESLVSMRSNAPEEGALKLTARSH